MKKEDAVKIFREGKIIRDEVSFVSKETGKEVKYDAARAVLDGESVIILSPTFDEAGNYNVPACVIVQLSKNNNWYAKPVTIVGCNGDRSKTIIV